MAVDIIRSITVVYSCHKCIDTFCSIIWVSIIALQNYNDDCNMCNTSLLLQHQGLSSMFYLLLYSACKHYSIPTSKDFVWVCGASDAGSHLCEFHFLFSPFQAKFSLVFVLQQTTAMRFFWQRQNMEGK